VGLLSVYFGAEAVHNPMQRRKAIARQVGRRRPRVSAVLGLATGLICAGLASSSVGSRAFANSQNDGYANAVLADRPIGFWPLGEPQSYIPNAQGAVPVARDISGYGRDGVYQLTTLATGGPVDSNEPITAFDRNCGGVDLSRWETAFANQNQSLEFWTRPFFQPAVSVLYGGSVPLLEPTLRTGYIVEGHRSLVGDNSWHHVVYALALAGGLKIFVDGELVDTVTDSRIGVQNFQSTLDGLAIGRRGNSLNCEESYFGLVSRFSIYNYSLSPEKVVTHYSAMYNGRPPVKWNSWHLGDVHAHASGDTGLDIHPACVSKFYTEAQCAGYLVHNVLTRASRFGAEWVVFTEHGPWLGFLKAQSPYDSSKAASQWETIQRALDASAVEGIRGLMGEELGTSAPSCASEDVDPRLKSPGHFGVYSTPTIVDKSIFSCNETGSDSYIGDTAAVGGFGGINHPDNTDGGSRWNCFTTGANGQGNDCQPVLFHERKCPVGADFYAPTDSDPQGPSVRWKSSPVTNFPRRIHSNSGTCS
jgi:hypothetical protein